MENRQPIKVTAKRMKHQVGPQGIISRYYLKFIRFAALSPWAMNCQADELPFQRIGILVSPAMPLQPSESCPGPRTLPGSGVPHREAKPETTCEAPASMAKTRLGPFLWRGAWDPLAGRSGNHRTSQTRFSCWRFVLCAYAPYQHWWSLWLFPSRLCRWNNRPPACSVAALQGRCWRPTWTTIYSPKAWLRHRVECTSIRPASPAGPASQELDRANRSAASPPAERLLQRWSDLGDFLPPTNPKPIHTSQAMSTLCCGPAARCLRTRSCVHGSWRQLSLRICSWVERGKRWYRRIHSIWPGGWVATGW